MKNQKIQIKINKDNKTIQFYENSEIYDVLSDKALDIALKIKENALRNKEFFTTSLATSNLKLEEFTTLITKTRKKDEKLILQQKINLVSDYKLNAERKIKTQEGILKAIDIFERFRNKLNLHSGVELVRQEEFLLINSIEDPEILNLYISGFRFKNKQQYYLWKNLPEQDAHQQQLKALIQTLSK